MADQRFQGKVILHLPASVAATLDGPPKGFLAAMRFGTSLDWIQVSSPHLLRV